MIFKSSSKQKPEKPGRQSPSRQAECCKSAWRKGEFAQLPHASAAWLK